MSEVKKWKTEELELLNRLVGAAFCQELNQRRKAIDPADVAAVYDLSFWAHYELVTIHPWADGNGRTCRLLMNLLQWEFDVLPTKVLKEDKAEYIQALIDTRESDLPKWLQASVSTAVLYPSIWRSCKQTASSAV